MDMYVGQRNSIIAPDRIINYDTILLGCFRIPPMGVISVRTIVNCRTDPKYRLQIRRLADEVVFRCIC